MKKEVKHIWEYIKDNKIASIVILYCIIAIILDSLSIVDITIPCLWTSIFGFRCPGCGLTTATIQLTHFDIIGAFKTNPLVFIILPCLLYYIITDFIKFKKKQQNNDSNSLK